MKKKDCIDMEKQDYELLKNQVEKIRSEILGLLQLSIQDQTSFKFIRSRILDLLGDRDGLDCMLKNVYGKIGMDNEKEKRTTNSLSS